MNPTEYVPAAGANCHWPGGSMVMAHLDDTTGVDYWQLAMVLSGDAATGYNVRMERSGVDFRVPNSRLRGLSHSEAQTI